MDGQRRYLGVSGHIVIDSTFANLCILFSMKYFDHPDLQGFSNKHLRDIFQEVRYFKPKASRSDSSETYWVCRGYLGGPAESERSRGLENRVAGFGLKES